jgi:hypothetical protein
MVLKAFKNNIKDNMITSKDATYTANGKEVKATKNTIHLDEDSVKTLGYNVCKELSNNSEFMNLFKGNMQTILKNSINSVIERYETKSEDTTSSSYSSYVTTPLTDLDFSIYTTGFIPKATRYEFYQRYEVRYSEEYLERISKSSYNNYKSPADDGIQEISSTVAVNIIDDNNYEIVVNGGGVTQAININMNTDKNNKNKGEVSISTDYASFGKISVNIAYQRELNREVPAPQTTGAITLKQLTSADYQKLLTDLSAHEVTKPLASSAYYLIMYLYYAQQQSTTTSTNSLASLYGTTDITNTTSTTPDTTSTVPAGKQKIGDEDNGYLIVADTWTDAYGATSRLQYANYPNGATGSVSAVLTMDNKSTLENSAEEWATTIYNTEKNDSKTKTVNASTTKVGNYNAYKVEKERNDGYKQIGWFFETEDGKTHCIIIGGNNLTEDTLSIVDTYTTK